MYWKKIGTVSQQRNHNICKENHNTCKVNPSSYKNLLKENWNSKSVGERKSELVWKWVPMFHFDDPIQMATNIQSFQTNQKTKAESQHIVVTRLLYCLQYLVLH